jgi:general secretion pathway protein G
MRTRRENRRGFTLVEVLLVVLILGMLATVAIVALGPRRKQARIDTTKLKISQVETALSLYNNDIGHFPTQEEGGLQALRTEPTFDEETLSEKWHGPYLKDDPVDAWDRPFHYEEVDATTATDIGRDFKLWSDGPDKQDGTDDDIRNWKEET